MRCPDPFVRLSDGWLVRQLAPDSSPIEIDSMRGQRNQDRLLHAMAWEAANVHLGTAQARERILNDASWRWLAHPASTVARKRKGSMWRRISAYRTRSRGWRLGFLDTSRLHVGKPPQNWQQNQARRSVVRRTCRAAVLELSLTFLKMSKVPSTVKAPPRLWPVTQMV